MSPFYGGLIFSAVRMLPNSFSFAYLLALGLSAQDVSIARSVQLVALVALEVPAGLLADRFGPRVAVAAASAFSATWLSCLAGVTSLPTLIVAELANAASLSLFSGAFEILLRDTYPGTNPIARFAKLQSLWIAAATLLGAGIATVITRQVAYGVAAAVQAGLLTALAYSAWTHWRPAPSTPRTAPVMPSMRTLRSLPRVLLIRVTATTVAYELCLQFWQPLIVLAGWPAGKDSLLVAVALGSMVAMSAAGAHVERGGSHRIMVATALVLAATMVAAGRDVHVVAATAVWVLVAIFLGTTFEIRSAVLLAKTVQGPHEVALYSLTSMIARVGTAVAVFGFGAVFASVTTPGMLLGILAGALAAAALLSTLSDAQHRAAHHEEDR